VPKKKQTGINPELEKFINTLMEQVMTDPQASVTDRVKVLDRALKLEALKAKMSDDEWGSGFMNMDDDE
jgi:hypothetical protein